METITIETLSIEILEEILKHLDLLYLCDVGWRVSYTWSLAVHNIISAGFRKYGPLILRKLNTAREDLLQFRSPSTAALDNEIGLVAEYSFLQILHSEYRVIYVVFWNHSAYNHLELVSQAGVCLSEFQRLLEGIINGIWDWKVENITFALDRLRSLNTKFLHYFFWQVWNPIEEKLGPMVIEILDCSVNSNYSVTLSYDKDKKYENSQCHICGMYEVQDLSNAMKSLLPKLWKHQPVVCARILVCHICDALRGSNLFYMLRLRWVCMDRALAIGRRRIQIEESNPYINDLNNNQTEPVSVEEADKSLIVKKFERQQSQISNVVSRLGIRCEFQLWCPLTQAPVCLVGRQCRLHCDSLPICEEETTCTNPYHFKMEFKACTRTVTHRFNKCTVWVEETAHNISIDQNKETVTE